MNLYEHTIIAKQDVSPSQIKQIIEKYSKIVEKLEGDLVKTENWGLLDLSYIINQNKKGNYIHFKIKGKREIISELEKNEKIDKNLLKYMTIKVKKFDLDTNYFSNKEKNQETKNNSKTPNTLNTLTKKIILDIEYFSFIKLKVLFILPFSLISL